MDDKLKALQEFYKDSDIKKAQAIKDPVALATYVTRRYGSMDKFAMARGMVGKQNAKKWNPVRNTPSGVKKSGKSAGATVQGSIKTTSKKKGGGGGREKKQATDMPRHKTTGRRAITGGGYFEGGKGGTDKYKKAMAQKRRGKGTKKSLDFNKAQAIEDSRELAHHLAGPGPKSKKGGNKSLWHAGTAGASSGDRSWKDYEGGIRSKDNAKNWNPVEGPPGSKYKKDGYRVHEKKKKKEQARIKGKYAGRAGPASKKPSERTGEAYQQPRLFKALDVLMYKAKFGGKPLGWEDLPRDPIAFATNVMNHKGFWYSNIKAGTKGAKMRNKLSQGIRGLVNKIPEASVKEKKSGKIEDDKDRAEAKRMAEEMENSWKKGERPDTDVKKSPLLDPNLARLLGFGAGWALSDTFVEAPRGQMTPSQQRQWERVIRSAMRRKKGLQKDAIDSLKSHYSDSSDTYIRKIPIQNALNIIKDHAPVPPRQGLVWDEQKSHWTRQENVGHSVSEVQGKKRIRGSGTGTHEHSRAAGGIGGKGSGMSAEAGRRFRTSADVGRVSPHQGKHPSTSRTKITRSLLSSVLARRGHKTSH